MSRTDTPSLTDAEKGMAAMCGMTEDQYAGYRSRQPDMAKLEPDPVDARIKAAVAEALAEHDAEAT
jgi:hypothetical protein